MATDIIARALALKGGGGGAVDSVNGQTGTVVLAAVDVGAYELPSEGIPRDDLDVNVREALARADFAELTSNKVMSISVSSTNDQYPTAKAVYDYINTVITNAIGGEY